MNGRTDKEILKERKEIVDAFDNRLSEIFIDAGIIAVSKKRIELIDSFYEFGDMSDNNYINEPLLYLGRSIIDLASADVVIFASGWETARECKIEHECAVSYGIPIWYYQPGLPKLKAPCLMGADLSRGDDFCAT